MANMQLEKVKMRYENASLRSTNFSEVAQGYNEVEAHTEALRCLNCLHKPCVSGCPVNVEIPDFIKALSENRLEDALAIIHKTNNFPSICGRVCPQENQCEKQCVRGIKGESVAIGSLERYVADHAKSRNNHKNPTQSKSVAIIGSGPAGLSCASDLAKLGYPTTIYEALHTTGGVLTYGIPEFRLPKKVVQKEIEALKEMNVKICTNSVIGRTLSLDDLEEMDYQAIFIGTGAGLPNFMNIKNENALGVYSANEFLTRVNLMQANNNDYDTPIIKPKHTLVVGGGNVAMDAARCAKRLGSDVTVIYRRSAVEMPARAEEVEHAKEEGIVFEYLCNPLEIKMDEKHYVSGAILEKMVLTKEAENGRRGVQSLSGSEFELEADCVIIAIGTSCNPILTSVTKDLLVNKRGCIIVNENNETTRNHVYAGGDAVSGAATVIEAMHAGKVAAEAIHQQLSNKY